MYTVYVRMCVHCIHTGYTVHPCTTSSTENIRRASHYHCLSTDLYSLWMPILRLRRPAVQICMLSAGGKAYIHHASYHLEPPLHTHTHIATHSLMNVATHICTVIHTYVCATMHTHIHMYIHVRIHTYIVSHRCLFLCLFRLQ